MSLVRSTGDRRLAQARERGRLLGIGGSVDPAVAVASRHAHAPALLALALRRLTHRGARVQVVHQHRGSPTDPFCGHFVVEAVDHGEGLLRGAGLVGLAVDGAVDEGALLRQLPEVRRLGGGALAVAEVVLAGVDESVLGAGVVVYCRVGGAGQDAGAAHVARHGARVVKHDGPARAVVPHGDVALVLRART